MKSNNEIIRQFKSHHKASMRGNAAQFDNIRKCRAAYSGDTMAYSDTIQFTGQNGQKAKATVKFNKIKPYVNAVRGFMAQNRRVAKYTAMNGTQLQTLYSQYANALADDIRENGNFDQVETQQDGDLLIDGIGATETAVTYGEGHASRNPNGEIICGRLDVNSLGWDPAARATNLLDARFVWYKKEYHIDEALELFSNSKEDDFDELMDEEAENYQYYPQGGAYDKISMLYDVSDQESGMVNVYFYQWYDIDTFYRCDNPLKAFNNPVVLQNAMMQLQIMAQEAEGNGLFNFNLEDDILTFDAKIKGMMEEAFGDLIKIYDYKRKTFYTAVLSGSKVFTSYPNICQEGFTIKFKTGDWDDVSKIWTGMVNSMIEPQKYYNKALTELMFIIGTNSKGGVMAERSAIENIREFESKYAKTDSVIIVSDGALQQGKIQPKKSPFAPTGYENIITLSDASIADVSGIDRSFLGSSENRQETAILQRQRIKQVVSTLACFFDSISLYQKEHARMLLDFMRVYAENNDGRIFKTISPMGRMEFLTISADKFVAEYDISIQEAPTTSEERIEQANVLTTIADKLMSMGDPTGKAIYAIALKYVNLEADDLQKVQDMLMPQDQNIDPAYVQQLEQTVQQLQSEGNQAQLQKLLSEININMAKVEQMRSDAQKTDADTIKTVAETERIDRETSLIDTDTEVRVVI